MRLIRWAAFLLVALLGLAIRLPQLGARPMHTDEAVNAYIIGQLLAGEPFRYDPQDRHGPALDAFAFPLAKIQGAATFADLTESQLRLAPVLAGTVTILLFAVAAKTFGFLPSLIAALLFACAPLPLYYDRYFIHESLFVAATFGLILSALRLLGLPHNSPVPRPFDFFSSKGRETTTHTAGTSDPHNSSGPRPFDFFSSKGRETTNARRPRTNSTIVFALTAAACAALMLACKETAILHFFALAAAAILFHFWNLCGKSLRGFIRPKPLLAAAFVFLLLSLVLFTWFGTNWNALHALWQAVPDALARAGGEGHQKPFWYYVRLLAGGWSGGLLLALAAIAFIQTVRKRDPSPFAFLAYYFLFIATIYCAIPYKTPWLALNFWLPIAFLAGRAIESTWRIAATRFPLRAAAPFFAAAGIVAAALIAHDTRQRVFLHPADDANPYAYAHTSEDLLGLPAEIEEFSRRNAIPAPRIAVIAADPWPLPWYLRRFSHVGFWQPGQQPADADFYITSTDAAGQYSERLRGLRPDFFGVRPGVLILVWFPSPK